MVLSMFKDDIRAAYHMKTQEANEALKRGDKAEFFRLSYEALDIVNKWINMYYGKGSTYLEEYEKALRTCDILIDEQQRTISQNYLDLAVAGAKAGRGFKEEEETKFYHLNKIV